MNIIELLGVYDADGGLRGEVRYIVGHLLGLTECSLCDITHSPVRRKPAWDALVHDLGLPFATVHRNEVPERFASLVASATLPLVAAAHGDGHVAVLIGPDALARCEGDVERFRAVLLAALGRDQQD